MNLFDLFKRQKTRFITKELISLSSLANVPTIDYFKDNNQVLELINLRKKEYLEILIKEKVLTSKDLKANELHNKLNRIHNLIEQNTLGDELFEKVIFNEEDKVKALVKLRKFALYKEQIIELEEEIISRVIALKEILKKTFLNRQKRISIINEINNLTNIFVILMNQKETLRLCLNNYGLKCFDITKEKDKEKEEKLIRKRKEELNVYQIQAFGKIVYELNDLNDMAKVEVALEEYVYNYKESTKLYIGDAIRVLQDSIELDLRNKETNFKIYAKILELKNKCKIFYEFGQKIIDMEDFKKLYRLKFKYFTTWRYENWIPELIDVFINYETPELEINTYKEMIYEIIKKINSLDYLIDIQITFNIDNITTINLLRIIKKELQTNGKYDPIKILMDKYKLNILLAFADSINTKALKEIYRNIYVLKSSYPEVNFYEPEFSWDDYLPLETINELKLIQNQKKDIGLYLFLKKYSNEYRSEVYRYTLPEGLRIIDNIDNMPNDVRNFINALQKNMKGKDVIMPSTLKKLKGNIFESTPIQTLILNDELEYCDFDFLPSSSIQGITIPTKESLLEFHNYFPFFHCKNLKSIEFKNFDQWEFYNNIEKLIMLLEPFITVDHLEEDTNEYDSIEKRYKKIRTYELAIDKIFFTFSEGEIVVIKRKDWHWQVQYMSTYYDISAFVKNINKELTDGVNLNNNQKRKLTKH